MFIQQRKTRPMIMALGVLCCALATAGTARADVINDFDGTTMPGSVFTFVGNFSTQSQASSAVAPKDGSTFQGFLDAGNFKNPASPPAVSDTTLELFFGLTPGQLDAFFQRNITDGSGFLQTFTQATAFDLDFDYKFLNGELAPAGTNDVSFFTLQRIGDPLELIELLDTTDPLTGGLAFPTTQNEDGTPGFPTTPYFTLSSFNDPRFRNLAAGSYRLGFGVVNSGFSDPDGVVTGFENDMEFDSGLFVDRIVTVTAVPEPGTMSLMGLGLLSLAAARRRKKLASEASLTDEESANA